MDYYEGFEADADGRMNGLIQNDQGILRFWRAVFQVYLPVIGMRMGWICVTAKPAWSREQISGVTAVIAFKRVTHKSLLPLQWSPRPVSQ